MSRKIDNNLWCLTSSEGEKHYFTSMGAMNRFAQIPNSSLDYHWRTDKVIVHGETKQRFEMTLEDGADIPWREINNDTWRR